MNEQHPIIERAVAGSRRDLDRLLQASASGLRNYVRIHQRWSRNIDVEDVIQVTFMEAFLRIESLERRDYPGFVSWLKRIAANNLKDALKELQRDKRPDVERRITHGVQGESARTLIAGLPGTQGTAGSQASLVEELVRLNAAIEKLPPTYRQVVMEIDLDERPIAEVAKEMGRSLGAIHMLRSRARDRLRELLAE